MKIREIVTEMKCWPGHRQVGTQPGTGKNAGKRVPDCEKIKKEDGGVGIITKQNSTADVGPGTIRKNLKAFDLVESPMAGDYFDIEITEEEVLSTYIDHITETGDIVLACDDGLFEALYHGRHVELNKRMAGDVKKSKVYVKDPKTGNIKKVNFGDKTMRIKKSNPARRRSFRARHNCANPGPKTKARYWSCRAW
jgi:hypothetical protein